MLSAYMLFRICNPEGRSTSLPVFVKLVLARLPKASQPRLMEWPVSAKMRIRKVEFFIIKSKFGFNFTKK